MFVKKLIIIKKKRLTKNAMKNYKLSTLSCREHNNMGFNLWALMRKNLSPGFANNKGADQPAHPCRLISAFVIRFLECNINKLAKGEISNF